MFGHNSAMPVFYMIKHSDGDRVAHMQQEIAASLALDGAEEAPFEYCPWNYRRCAFPAMVSGRSFYFIQLDDGRIPRRLPAGTTVVRLEGAAPIATGKHPVLVCADAAAFVARAARAAAERRAEAAAALSAFNL